MTISTKISEISRLNPFQKKALSKLGINTVIDLLYHFPTRYGDTSETKNIGNLIAGENAVIFGKISGLKTGKGFKTKITMANGYVEDETGGIKCVWFNQPYMAKMVNDGSMVRIEGKVSKRKKDNEIYFSNPKIEVMNKLPIGVGDSLFGKDGEAHILYPIYKESNGITSNWFYHKINEIFKSDLLSNIEDPIPEDILKKYNLPSIKTALIWIHTPMKKADAESARKRFAFEEIFFIQLQNEYSRKEYRKNPSFIIKPGYDHIQQFIKRFPFKPTDAQVKATDAIINDFGKGYAMSRLLEGDVGSGKTAVAATTTYAIVTTKASLEKDDLIKPDIKSKMSLIGPGHLQVAYMCPTEILATQHFESFIQYFSYLGIQIALITGSGCRKFPSKINPKGWTDISRSQLLKWIKEGEISVVIGTHALIQKTVKFKNLAYAIIDEQHRFGINTRRALIKRDETGVTRAPHLLSMTATPIPRTLALTIYGDLDITLLDEVPQGRQAITTEIVKIDDRKNVYEKIREEINNGRQAYVICPRIDEPDPDKEKVLQLKSVKEEAKRLKKDVFKEFNIGIMHSKMKPDEKDKVMKDFKDGKIDILCSTSVVEVGVNVPNATMIIIEGAERFGLAQLHQLRGRVMRSTHKPYCFIFTEKESEKTFERLSALKNAKNGFELAEYDLKFRGAGELSGNKQWGVSDIAMESLKNIKMVELAKEEAKKLFEDENIFRKYPKLKEIIEKSHRETHLE
jgi:ATP-dependent DNA helicase RecG